MHIQITLDQIQEASSQLSPYCSKDDLIQTFNSLSEFMDYGGGYPEDSFSDSRGEGSYKEAYAFGTVVVKFAVSGAIMDTEIATYYAAHNQYDVDYILCPTFFIPVPDGVRIPLSKLDEEYYDRRHPEYCSDNDDGSGGSFGSQIAKYIIIQPRCYLLNNYTYPKSPISYEESAGLILQNGSRLSTDEYLILDAPLEWRQAIIDAYGDCGYRDISWALKRMEVIDLHEGNVAWLNDKPVIIDWMSLPK